MEEENEEDEVNKEERGHLRGTTQTGLRGNKGTYRKAELEIDDNRRRKAYTYVYVFMSASQRPRTCMFALPR